MSRLLFMSSLLAGTIFAIATVPMNNIQAQSFEVKLQDKSLFSSNFQDFAVPYLGGVGLISLGAGFTVLTLWGWHQTSRKLSESQAIIDQLKQENLEKSDALEKLQFSEKHLNKLGLDMFLENESSDEEISITPELNNQQQLNEDQLRSSQVLLAEAAIPTTTVPAVNEKFSVIEHLLNSARPLESELKPIHTSRSPLQLDRLLQELKHLTTQLESAKGNHADSFSSSYYSQQISESIR